MVEEGSHENVEVRSAAEIDTTRRGSGFPRMRDAPSSFATKKKSGGGDDEEKDNDGNNDKMEEEEEDEMVAKMRKSPWNLNNLPVLRGPQANTKPISKFTGTRGWFVATVFIRRVDVSSRKRVGTWKKIICIQSPINTRAPRKCGTRFPRLPARRWRTSFKRAVPDLFGCEPDAMIHVVTMLPPSTLRNDNVPVFRVQQNPGDFIVTFPIGARASRLRVQLLGK